jgi:hypothetical protein
MGLDAEGRGGGLGAALAGEGVGGDGDGLLLSGEGGASEEGECEADDGGELHVGGLGGLVCLLRGWVRGVMGWFDGRGSTFVGGSWRYVSFVRFVLKEKRKRGVEDFRKAMSGKEFLLEVDLED